VAGSGSWSAAQPPGTKRQNERALSCQRWIPPRRVFLESEFRGAAICEMRLVARSLAATLAIPDVTLIARLNL
jgi:hypothetical protein